MTDEGIFREALTGIEELEAHAAGGRVTVVGYVGPGVPDVTSGLGRQNEA
jgi:hypothetical protein